jgi:hypothetical protein
MADGRKNNGGHSTKGRAGRKPKAEELKLIEKLTPYEGKALELLFKKIDEGDMYALKMFMEYLHGKPKQMVENWNNHNFDGGIDLKSLFGDKS